MALTANGEVERLRSLYDAAFDDNSGVAQSNLRTFTCTDCSFCNNSQQPIFRSCAECIMIGLLNAVESGEILAQPSGTVQGVFACKKKQILSSLS